MRALWSTVCCRGTRSPSRHFGGLPLELTAGVDERVALAHPAILTIEESPQGTDISVPLHVKGRAGRRHLASDHRGGD
jgi:hypothetical protein